MAEKKSTKKEKVETVSCADKFCPFHGRRKLKLRGRIFEGEVVKKLHDRISIQFERMMKVKKYERYEKRRTKIHARLPDCMKDQIQVGDKVQIAECRPLSKMIHFVVVKVIKKGGKEE